MMCPVCEFSVVLKVEPLEQVPCSKYRGPHSVPPRLGSRMDPRLTQGRGVTLPSEKRNPSLHVLGLVSAVAYVLNGYVYLRFNARDFDWVKVSLLAGKDALVSACSQDEHDQKDEADESLLGKAC